MYTLQFECTENRQHSNSDNTLSFLNHSSIDDKSYQSSKFTDFMMGGQLKGLWWVHISLTDIMAKTKPFTNYEKGKKEFKNRI